MTVRTWLSAAAVSAGVILGGIGSTTAAEKSPEFTFGRLDVANTEVAKLKAEAWLKSTGKMEAGKFNAVWGNTDTTILDKLAETFKLGSPEAAKIIDESANAETIAPKAVPALLKDVKQNPFLRANLAVIYASNLATARVYEEALEALEQVKVEQVLDPSAYLFYRAVAEHALIKKTEAIKSTVRLLDDVPDAPDRHRLLAAILLVEMMDWKKDEKDLENIARLMDNSERRLDLSRGGKTTQEIQDKIVKRLDELIKEKEAQCNGQCNGGSCPGGGKPGSKLGPGGIRSASPAPDSGIMKGSGPGNVDTEKKIRNLSEQWGKMKESERAKALTDISKNLPPSVRVVIENYFKSLSKKDDH